jgi:AraC-like DNA-binding protein
MFDFTMRLFSRTKKRLNMKPTFHYYFKNQFKPLASLSLSEVAYFGGLEPYTLPLERPDAYAVYLVVEGKGVFSLGGSEFPVRVNDVFVMYPDVAVRCSMCGAAADKGEDGWELMALSFNGVDARLLLNAAGFEPQSPVRSLDAHTASQFAKVYDGIYVWRGQEIHSLVQSTSMIYLFLAALVKTASWDQSAMPPGWTGAVHFQKALDFIAANYMKTINVSDVADHVALSRSRLYRVFMQQIFVSPQQYLTEYRIREAIRLLQMRKGSVKEIALAVGFEDQIYFSSMFKKVMGKSPANYVKGIIEEKEKGKREKGKGKK